MRATEFITEDEVKPYEFETLKLKKALDILRTYCSESFALIDKPIWRGMKNHGQQIIKIDPSTGVRKSQNTSNYYTQIIDHSPYMEGWPKRSQSLICSTSSSYADRFKGVESGGKYAIFPMDGVKIAVCPSKDMWYTPVTVPEINVEFNSMWAMESLNDFLKKLGLSEDYNNMLKTLASHNWHVKCRSKFGIPGKEFLPAIQKALSPAVAGFTLMSIQEFAASTPNNKEVWIGGPVIAIREDMYTKFAEYAAQEKSKVPQ